MERLPVQVWLLAVQVGGIVPRAYHLRVPQILIPPKSIHLVVQIPFQEIPIRLLALLVLLLPWLPPAIQAIGTKKQRNAYLILARLILQPRILWHPAVQIQCQETITHFLVLILWCLRRWRLVPKEVGMRLPASQPPVCLILQQPM